MRGIIGVHGSRDPLEAFAGESLAADRVREAARCYAVSDSPLLISGETGTGKELVAHAVHALSDRSSDSFIPINCAAFSQHLVESELFGHVAGAFTGAARSKQGLLRVADGGTLFLDEIADLPRSVQSKILRVLQFGTFYSVGGEEQFRVDVRIISAINPTLGMDGALNSAQEGLREDIFHRLNVLGIHIPPLRERRDDILPIMHHVAARRGMPVPRFDPAAESMLLSHSFPGNVRELENLLERINHHPRSRARRGSEVSADLLGELLHGGHPDVLAGCPDLESTPRGTPAEESNPPLRNHAWKVPDRNERDPDYPPTGIDRFPSLAEYVAETEARAIRQAMTVHRGNLTRTAKALGLSRQGLRNKIKRYRIKRST